MALLEVRNLTKRFGGLTGQQRDRSGDVRKAACSPSSARTAPARPRFFNMVSGFCAADVRHDRSSPARTSPNARRTRSPRKGLVRTFQLVQLFKGMTVAENVEVGFHLATKGGVAAALLAAAAGSAARKPTCAARRASSSISSALPARRSRDAELLPYGQQRLLEVARALAAQAAPASARRAGGRPQRA